VKADVLVMAAICLAIAVTALLAARRNDSETAKPPSPPGVCGKSPISEAHLQNVSQAELEANRGPGWVFGRVMGVANAPGTGTFSPYGGVKIAVGN